MTSHTDRMLTVIGDITRKGFVQHQDRSGDTRYSFTPAVNYQRQQPADIAVHLEHDVDLRVGTCLHLERSRADGLVAVAEIDADLGDILTGDWHWSDGISSRPLGTLGERGDVTINELSLVRAGRQASQGTRPVRFARGAIGTAGAPLNMPLNWYSAWERAAEAAYGSRYRRAPDHVTIHDVDDLTIPETIATDPVAGRAMLAAAAAASPARTRSVAPQGYVFRHSVGGSLHPV